MIRSLLVPIDGTPSSFHALTVAASIAGISDAALIGLFVEDENRFLRLSPGFALAGSLTGQPVAKSPVSPRELLEVDEKIEGEVADYRERFDSTVSNANVRGRFTVSVGKPGEVIARLAKTVDMVVIGSAGAHAAAMKADRDHTTSFLLRHTIRPVLIVPERAYGGSSMLVAYDGSVRSERVLRESVAFAMLTGLAEVHLLTASDSTDRAKEIQSSAIEYLAHYEVETHSILASGEPEQAIVHYIEEADPSILAIGSYGSGFLIDYFFGSTTDYVLENASQTAVLVVG